MDIVVLRNYQNDAICDVRAALRAGYRFPLLVLGTGAGKTVIFSSIVKSAVSKGKRVLVLAHRDKLISQASAKLTDNGVDHGIIMADAPTNMALPVQVGSVQTLIRRIKRIRYHFDIIIIDEAHLSATASYINIVEAIDPEVVLGVTGSPQRLDGKGLGRHAGGLFDVLVEGVALKYLIHEGYLVQPRVFSHDRAQEMAAIKDYRSEALTELMDRPSLVGNAVSHYASHGRGLPALAWCTSIAHAESVSSAFNSHGICSAVLSGNDDSDTRDRILADLAAGHIKVVAFCNLLIEGVDVPEIGVIIILRPTDSLSAYLQVGGRGLRPVYAPGMPLDTVEQRFAAMRASAKGEHLIILDHAGCTFNHGFLTDEREWSLDGRAKLKRLVDDETVPIKQCPECYHIHEPSPSCPACGFVYRADPKKIEHAEGVLREITPEMIAEREQEEAKRELKRQQGRAQDVKSLMALGHSQGRAEKIVAARAEKKALIAETLAVVSRWQASTNGSVFTEFGVTYSDIRNLKPKRIKEILVRINELLAATPGGSENPGQSQWENAFNEQQQPRLF